MSIHGIYILLFVNTGSILNKCLKVVNLSLNLFQKVVVRSPTTKTFIFHFRFISSRERRKVRWQFKHHVSRGDIN